MKKIINIIIFTIAGLASLLALVFVGIYKDDKTLYDEVSLVKEKTPEAIEDLLLVTYQDLPDYVTKYQDIATEKSTELKEKQLPKDILYTYITQLQELTEETFPEFKDNFEIYAAALFAKSEHKEKYVDGLNKVDNYEALASYIHTLENEYATIKRDYLYEKEQLKALNGMIGRASLITETVSEKKQISQIEELQESIKSASKSGKILNLSISFFYSTLFAAIILTILFALFQIIANIKHSYQVFIGIGIMVIFFLIAYFVSPSELTSSAIKMQHTTGDMKIIGAGMLTLYVVLFGAILAIIISYIINMFKKV